MYMVENEEEKQKKVTLNLKSIFQSENELPDY